MNASRKPHILVIDDNRSFRAMLAKYLTHHGYTASQAGTSEEAIALCGQELVNAVVLDIQLGAEIGLVPRASGK